MPLGQCLFLFFLHVFCLQEALACDFVPIHFITTFVAKQSKPGVKEHQVGS